MEEASRQAFLKLFRSFYCRLRPKHDILKIQASPMKHKLRISLHSLQKQGLDFDFNKSNSKELRQVLRDLIDNNDYEIQGHIKAIGDSSYRISGTIKTNINLLCSRCAYEYQHVVDKNFSEDIYIHEKQLRKDKEVRINHFSEQTQNKDFTILNRDLFSLDEFLHELIAVEESPRPVPFPQCEENNDCEHLQNIQAKGILQPERTNSLKDQLQDMLKKDEE